MTGGDDKKPEMSFVFTITKGANAFPGFIERVLSQKYSPLQRFAGASVLSLVLVVSFVVLGFLSVGVHYLVGERFFLDTIVMLPLVPILLGYIPLVMLLLSSARINGWVLSTAAWTVRLLRRGRTAE